MLIGGASRMAAGLPSGYNRTLEGDAPSMESEPNAMSDRAQAQKTKLETVEPLGKRVLIRKDEDKKVTKGGIELPDSIEIPTITGRVVAVSALITNDDDYPVKQYDRVLFNPKHAIPVEFDPGNCLYVVPLEDVVAVFRKTE